MTLKSLIERAVLENRREIFVVDREIYRRKAHTYEEIYFQALSLCGFFKKNKIKKGDRVILYLPNSSDYASLLWACAISGVIAVPIDFNNNPEFIARINKEVQASLIFCSLFRQPDLKSRSAEKNLVFQEQMADIYTSKTNENEIVSETSEKDIFEIVYTSGTTSEPKGVVLTNKNLVSNINSMKKVIDFRVNGSSLLSILPLSHLFEQNVGFFLPMSLGATVVYSQSRKSSAIIKAIRDEKIKIIVTVPIFMSSIKDKIIFEAEKLGKKEGLMNNLTRFSGLPKAMRKIIFSRIRRKLGRLQYFICGGAALDEEVEMFWRNLGYEVIVGYGLTETSPVLACNSKKENLVGSAGKPLPGIEIRIAEDKEIIARGSSVFNGYYKNPEKTRETLKNGWIHTGDLGSIDEKGFLKITGRKKNIIISSSGLNVYPEDIEKILDSFPEIKESVVLGMENGKYLLGIVLSNSKINPSKMLEEANHRLMSHQVLSEIIQWPEEDFPRTTTRKVIRRKVEERIMQIKEGGRQKEKVFAKDALTKIVSEILELSPEKLKESSVLSSAGLDSLKRIDLAVKIEEAFDMEEFDEDEVNQRTRLRDLRKAVEKAKSRKSESGINILNSRIFEPIRLLMQSVSFFAAGLLYTRKVSGLENLELVPKNQPVIFIANHISLLDTFSVYKSLPLRYRMNTYPAGAKDFFFSSPRLWLKILGIIGRLSYNVFSFSRTKGIKQSLKDFGEIINRGGNILIYPEGTRSNTGKLLPFKLGIGLLAWNMQVPVIPIKHEGLQEILPKGKLFPRTGHVNVKIGKPLKFEKMQSPQEITKMLEKAMKNL